MIKSNWQCQKCIQVFEVIKMEPRYEICVNTVIKELKLVDSSYSNPVQVVSTSSEEEILQMQCSPEYAEILLPLTTDEKLKADHSQAEALFDKYINQREILAKCPLFNGFINGKWEIKKFATILEENRKAIIQNTGMIMKVVYASFIKIFEGTGNDGLIYDLSDQGIKLREVLERLCLQTSPIDVKKIIREDLLPNMECIRVMVEKLTSPAQKSKQSISGHLWKSVKFQMVDADSENMSMLKALSYYKPILDYLVDLVSFLLELDLKSSNPGKSLEFLRKRWENYKKRFIKAMQDKENAIHSEALKRSTIGTLTYCGPVALGLLCYLGINVASLGSAALLFGCFGGAVQLYRMYTVPSTIKACKAESEKLAEKQDKISIKDLRKLYNHNP